MICKTESVEGSEEAEAANRISALRANLFHLGTRLIGAALGISNGWEGRMRIRRGDFFEKKGKR